jgi:hypothetical protein
MHIINTSKDICNLQERGEISKLLAQHLEKKLTALNQALEPETQPNEFSLGIYGPFCILEKGDKNLSAIGLPESLAEIMPEWVGRLVVGDEVYYVLYVMANNDFVIQVYLSDNIVEGAIRLWLSEQPLEEEGGADDAILPDMPY